MHYIDGKGVMNYRYWRDLCVDVLIARVTEEIISKHGGTFTSNISHYTDMEVVVVKVAYPKLTVRYEVKVPHDQIERVYRIRSIETTEYTREAHLIYASKAVSNDETESYSED